MADLQLTLACGPYDRTQALRDGTVRADGIELTYVAAQPAEIFWRMLQYREFEVSEMSMSNYISVVGAENPPSSRSRPFSRAYFGTATFSSTPMPASRSRPT